MEKMIVVRSGQGALLARVRYLLETEYDTMEDMVPVWTDENENGAITFEFWDGGNKIMVTAVPVESEYTDIYFESFNITVKIEKETGNAK